MGKFKRITTRNNWGNVEYYIGKKNPERLILVDGQAITVEWPDGTVWITNVLVRRHIARVSDMGHEYTVETHLYYVLGDVHGVMVEVPLHHLKVMSDG